MVRHGVVAALILGVPGVSVAQTDTAGDSARHHYRAGLQYETQRDLDAARRSYEEAVRQDPTFALAIDRLGFVYGLQGTRRARSRTSSRPPKRIPRSSTRSITSAPRCGGAAILAGHRIVAHRRAPAAESRGSALLPGTLAEEARRVAPRHRPARRVGPAERLSCRVSVTARRCVARGG